MLVTLKQLNVLKHQSARKQVKEISKGENKNKKRSVNWKKKKHEQWAKKKSRVAPEKNAYSSAGIKTAWGQQKTGKLIQGLFPRLSKGAEMASKHEHPPGSPKKHPWILSKEKNLQVRFSTVSISSTIQTLTIKKKKIIKHTRKHPPWERSSRSKKQKIQIPKNLSIYKENSKEARKVTRLDKRVQQDDWT